MRAERIFFFFLLVTLFSCRKEREDETPPKVRILSPIGGVQAGIPSSFRIKAEASDNLALRSITISLTRNGQSFTTPLVLSVSSKQATIDTLYSIRDIYLEGGSYSITVTADDGVQTTSDYSSIQLSPYPDSILGYWVAISSNTENKLLLLDSAFQTTQNWTLPDFPAGMEYNKRNDNLWLAFRNLNQIRGMQLDGGLNWEITSGNQVVAQFHPWAGKLEEAFYTCDRNGFVRSRDAFGQVLWAYTSPETQSIPYFLYRDQTRLFIGIQPNGNGEPRFKIIHALFSGQLLERTIQMTLSSIQKQDADRYWLFGWQGNNGIIARYQYTTNSWSVVKTLTGERVLSSYKAENGEILVATSSGIRRWITVSESLTDAHGPMNVSRFLKSANNQLIMVSDLGLFLLNGTAIYTPPSGYHIETACKRANK